MTDSKKMLISLITLSLMIGCSSNNTKKNNTRERNKKVDTTNDLKEMNLNGKINSIRKITYTVVNKFGKIKTGKKELDFSFNYDYYKTFDIGGNIILDERYKSDSSLVLRKNNKYDKYEKKTTSQSYESDELPYIDNEKRTKTTYKYNDENNKIEENTYQGDKLIKKIKLKYNTNGKLMEKNKYNSKGNLEEKIVLKYDSVDNKTLKKTYESDRGGRLSSETTFNYSLNGHDEVQKLYGPKGKVIAVMHQKFNNEDNLIEIESNSALLGTGDKHVYNYDKDGLDVSEKVYGKKQELKKETTYKYKFDKHHNWIKKIKLKNEIPKYITIRKFKYY